MTPMAETIDPPEIVVRNPVTGETFTLTPTPSEWLDWRAFMDANGLTLEQLINRALEDFLLSNEIDG